MSHMDGDLLNRGALRGAASEADPYATGRSHMSPMQAFVGRWIVSNLMGLTIGGWLRLLGETGPSIGPRYWSRAAVISVLSAFNSGAGLVERLRHGAAFAATTPVAPIFILGHWRSGTTLLHNLMALDPQLAAPNLFETMFPVGFTVTEKWQAPLWKRFVPETRLIDNMPLGTDLPQEDEFALAILTGVSPYMGHSFPRRWTHYMRYLDFSEISERETRRWKRAFVDYAKKLTVYRNNRTLVLKSPPHTARIPLILQMFPDARFIHVHRDPYRVFQSSLHMLTEGLPLAKLQSGDLPDPAEFVIDRYKRLYDTYLRDRDSIPAGRLVEVRFDDLAGNPVTAIEDVYRRLDLGGIATFRPALEAQRTALGSYAQNRYLALPDTVRDRIAREWARYFDCWGYDPNA